MRVQDKSIGERKRNIVFALVVLAVFIVGAVPSFATYVPWDSLVSNSWIQGASPAAKIYTVNSSSYNLVFGTKNSTGAARGMNAVMFSDGVNNTGHLKSDDLAGSFNIVNGGAQSWSKLLVMVAIQSETLAQDFSLSLAVSGKFSYSFNPTTDFCLYDHSEYNTGRPTGYYSATSPTGDDIAYDFKKGMVTIFELPSVSVTSGSLVTIDYAFTDLPGRAVFSAYAILGGSSVTHTNRAIADLKDSTAQISTFEVVPEPTTLVLVACGALALLRKRNVV
jgi:hypothetical protein